MQLEKAVARRPEPLSKYELGDSVTALSVLPWVSNSPFQQPVLKAHTGHLSALYCSFLPERVELVTQRYLHSNPETAAGTSRCSSLSEASKG